MPDTKLFGITNLAVLMLLFAACGGSDGGRNPVDPSAFVGLWTGPASITVSGQSSSGSAYTHITANGTELTIGDFCFDGTGPHATATKSTEFTMHAISCPPGPIGACSAVTFTVASGSGSLSGTTLTMNVTGTISGCGSTANYTFSFTGQK